MVIFTLLASAHAVTGFTLDATGLPLVMDDQVVQCPTDTSDGKYLRSWTSGAKLERGMCAAGLATDGWTGWHENGLKHWTVPLVEGRFEGTFKSWHDNGVLRAKGIYVGGLEEGTFRYWDADGVRIGRGRWEEGRKEGCWVETALSGERSKGPYADGEKVGRWLTWDTTGTRRKEVFGGEASSGGCLFPLL